MSNPVRRQASGSPPPSLDRQSFGARQESIRRQSERLDSAGDGRLGRHRFNSEVSHRSVDSHASGRAHYPNAREEFEEHGHTDHRALRLATKILGFTLTTIVAPFICRRYGLSIPQRCGVLFASVLLLNLTEALPLYCLSLFIPVLGTLCGVLGEKRSIAATATLLVSNVFNNISFLVLGALVTNGIFAKCGIDQRMIRWLLSHVPIESASFLLLLMLGTTAVASVLYSASLMLLGSLRVFLFQEEGNKDNVSIPIAKRILIGVAFASNAGSTWLPISSPVNLVAMGLLGNFDKKITSMEWAGFAVPVATMVVIGSWAALMLCFPNPQESAAPRRHRGMTYTDEELDDNLPYEQLQQTSFTPREISFMGLATVAVLLITAFPPQLEDLIGHPAIISLTVVVIVFGSGYMSREEFLQLDWDLLAIVGGTNVMAFLVRDTGLGATLSEEIVTHPYFKHLEFWSMLTLLVLGTLSVSSLLGHTMSGVILLPLIIAVGVKVQAAQTVALVCSVAVPFGMVFSHSSFDNVAALTTSTNLGKEEATLNSRDFRGAGCLTTIWGAIVLLSFGPYIGEMMYGPPPPLVVAEISDTPEELKPRVVKESLPEEVSQVKWKKDQLANWNEFLKRPDKKAFAVGTIEGMKARGWAASWNHPTQEGANAAALEHCEKLADECRIIYPSEDKGRGPDWVKRLPKPGGAEQAPVSLLLGATPANKIFVVAGEYDGASGLFDWGAAWGTFCLPEDKDESSDSHGTTANQSKLGHAEHRPISLLQGFLASEAVGGTGQGGWNAAAWDKASEESARHFESRGQLVTKSLALQRFGGAELRTSASLRTVRSHESDD